MPTIEIVKLKPECLERLINFFEEINSTKYTDDFSPHPFNAQYAKLICNYQGRDLYYSILLDGEKMIGYGMLRGWDEGYEIPSIGLCILKKHQGVRLGKLLVNFLETVSRLKGCSKVMLKVKKNNTIAKRLYESQKYVFIEHNEEFLIGFKSITE